ncbi:MAG TPA: D-glucuronyl C5-epimerase family protein [Gaiellaceae bacterium]|nr:D-glucuronyl C5-epimerase family protein [Gaiellaceae bacterium]
MSLEIGDPGSYHFDLRSKATAAGPLPDDGLALLRRLTSDPDRTNPVDVLQLGLGAVQLREPEWLAAAAGVVAWIESWMDEQGLLAYRFPMRHTFPLEPPWHSALAQGEAASFLVRCAEVLSRADLLDLAERAVAPLVDPASPLVASTAEGPVLQEYPTTPPAHVLNGWITSLWGLHDIASMPGPARTDVSASARAAFQAGVATLAVRLDRYRTPIGWSRYDLYPHPLANVASPFYHRLHVEQLRTLNAMAPYDVFTETADAWERAAERPLTRAFAVSRKVAFRLARPRWRRAR